MLFIVVVHCLIGQKLENSHCLIFHVQIKMLMLYGHPSLPDGQPTLKVVGHMASLVKKIIFVSAPKCRDVVLGSYVRGMSLVYHARKM